MTLPNQPTMPLSTARASAPPDVVSLLTAVHFHPVLTSVNHPHLIVGTKAAFKASSSEITTTVPTGATTGFVKVTTPKRTLKSNVVFRVTK